jgi:hypothetical protein
MILDEARIHKYTHTNYKISAMNIKYYNFGSSFDTIEFCSRKLHVDTKMIHSTIQGQHLALKWCPLNACRVSQHGVQQSSLDLSLITATSITGRERRTTCTQLD